MLEKPHDLSQIRAFWSRFQTNITAFKAVFLLFLILGIKSGMIFGSDDKVKIIPNALFSPKSAGEIPYQSKYLPMFDVPGKDVDIFPRPLSSIRAYYDEDHYNLKNMIDYRIAYYTRQKTSDVLGILEERFRIESMYYDFNGIVLLVNGPAAHGIVTIRELSDESSNIVLILYSCAVDQRSGI